MKRTEYKAIDVARHIVNYTNEQGKTVSNLKLQKLLYFVQGFFLALLDRPCFSDEIEAWDFGPVVPVVYRNFKEFGSNSIPKVTTVYDCEKENGESCCPADGKVCTGDYIVSVDGMEISKRLELLDIVAESQGDSLSVRYIRDGEEKVCSITPEKNENGAYLLGAWVKDDVSGIGTVTFVDGTNFMALGHSVSDIDTGVMMRCSTGGVYTTDITNISKSYSSEPGRLQGSIAYRRSLVGIIDGNSASGIYGHLDTSYCQAKYGDAERMYIARGHEVRKGQAYIYSRMSGELEKYEIDIEYVDRNSSDKNIEFHVTDDALIDLTGGVVQGMSGSPIIQDGKIIGAVTHVFVDDPTRGYGIFIENMLEE